MGGGATGLGGGAGRVGIASALQGNYSKAGKGDATTARSPHMLYFLQRPRYSLPTPLSNFQLGGPPIKRIGFLLKVKQDKIDEYKAHHRAVWPEMLDALRRNGWRNYSLFMREDGLMFGYFEADENFAAALEGMSKEDVNARWQELMSPFFEIPPGAHPDQTMLELQEVFHTD